MQSRTRAIATAAVAGLAVGLTVGLTAAAPARAQSGACATRNPVVLHSGLFNTRFDLFVVDALRACGARVFTSSGIDPTRDSMTRGAQLQASLREILATRGALRVNVLAHSQGALDARFVLGVQPEILASITTLAGIASRGTEAADVGLGLGAEVAFDLLRANAPGLESAPGSVEGFAAALRQLSIAGVDQFNQIFPLGLPARACDSGPPSANGVLLQSFGGVVPFTNAADPSDVGNEVTVLSFPPDTQSDGLVPRCSTHFGTVVSDRQRYNHLDYLGEVDGLQAPGEDAVALIVMIVTQLAQRGL